MVVITFAENSLFLLRHESTHQYQVSTYSVPHSSHSVRSHTRVATQNSTVVRWKSTLAQSWVTLCDHISRSHLNTKARLLEEKHHLAKGLKCQWPISPTEVKWCQLENKLIFITFLFSRCTEGHSQKNNTINTVCLLKFLKEISQITEHNLTKQKQFIIYKRHMRVYSYTIFLRGYHFSHDIKPFLKHYLHFALKRRGLKKGF